MALKFGLPEWRDYQRDDRDTPVVLCFGDSWFWYPIPGIGNLSDRFVQFGRYRPINNQAFDIVVLGRNGMEIEIPEKKLLEDMSTVMRWEKSAIRMIVVSGGGNDFAGADDLDPLLQVGKDHDVSSWFKPKQTSALFDAIKHGYENIIHLRDTFCPKVPIVTHCYDYPHATGTSLLWFSPWFKPSFDRIGMPEILRDAALSMMIDRFADMQRALAHANQPYHFVDTRNALAATDWANELHPTADGFDKLASRFHPFFAQYLPNETQKPSWVHP